MCSSDIFLAILACLFPPIAVWIKRGLCSVDSLINIALCILGFLPGLVHAWYIIASYPEESDYPYEQIPNDGGEAGAGRVTTYYYQINRREQDYPSPQQQQQQTGPKPKPKPKSPAPKGYGTTDRTSTNSAAAPAPVPEEGSSARGDQGVPPSYEQAIKGDHKVQT